jgi:hypothetical protein
MPREKNSEERKDDQPSKEKGPLDYRVSLFDERTSRAS